MFKRLFKYIRVIRFEFHIHIHKELPDPEIVEVEIVLPPLGTRERAEITSNKRDEWRRLHKEAATAYQQELQKKVYHDMYIKREREIEKTIEKCGRDAINN